jgi:uncharacterized membrane protein YccC
MVLIDGMEHRSVALGEFARSRLIEVSVGAFAAVLVSAVLAAVTPPPACAAPAAAAAAALVAPPAAAAVAPPAREPAPAPQRQLAPGRAGSAPLQWAAPVARAASALTPAQRRAARWHALQGALALALIPWVWRALHIQSLSQSSITIMAVMMVPAADLTAARHPAAARLRHRLIGCALGGLLATGILLAAHDFPLLMLLAVSLGVMAGRHVENGQLGVCYAGTQFALALLVVLVPDCYSAPHAGSGLERLCGVLFGMALLEPVRLLLRVSRNVMRARPLCRGEKTGRAAQAGRQAGKDGKVIQR